VNPTLPPLLVDVQQAAGLLSLSDRTIRTLVKRGELPHVRIGSRLLFIPKDLARWVEARRTPANAALSAAPPTAAAHDPQRNGEGFGPLVESQ
jgi:excisionase family DNA binding protein